MAPGRDPASAATGGVGAERPSEDALIARYLAPLAGPAGLGLKDDAACLSPAPGFDLVLTADGLVAGLHFYPDDPPASIARKALGVNVSDLAAKGARPLGFLLTLALPGDWSEVWLANFARGLGEAAGEWGCPLVGGDTTRTTGPLTLSITALGEVPAGRMVPRTGARPGERVVVTGTIGDAALGLAARQTTGEGGWIAAIGAAARASLDDRYLHPRPRIGLAEALREHASAAMDVSDGLAGDIVKLLRASGAGAGIDLASVPFSAAAAAAIAAEPDLRERAVTGGDDYEILASIADEKLASFLAACAALGVPATVIGTVRDAEAGTSFWDAEGEVRFISNSFSHF